MPTAGRDTRLQRRLAQTVWQSQKPGLWAEEPSLDPAEPKFGASDGDVVCALGVGGGGTSFLLGVRAGHMLCLGH